MASHPFFLPHRHLMQPGRPPILPLPSPAAGGQGVLYWSRCLEIGYNLRCWCCICMGCVRGASIFDIYEFFHLPIDLAGALFLYATPFGVISGCLRGLGGDRMQLYGCSFLIVPSMLSKRCAYTSCQSLSAASSRRLQTGCWFPDAIP